MIDTRESAASPWWAPHRHADRRPLLLARNRIQRAIRAWLAAEGFTEVDPAGLVVSPGNETHLHAFATTGRDTDGRARPLYLHTSPEFAMKKLLAAGETRIAAFAHVWRNGERGVLHEPEFTMLEWYRAGAGYGDLMADCATIVRLAARAAAGADAATAIAADVPGAAAAADSVAAGAPLRFGKVECDPFARPERLSVVDAFARHVGIDLLATLDDAGRPVARAMRDALAAAGIRAADDDGWSDMFSRVLVARIEPALGHGRATILDRYPAIEAALARRAPDDPRLSERFELYACGVELANGFGELTDPAEQRRRFEAEMDEKERLYGERYPIDEDFLAALDAMPAASGIALGFDRLVMLATGAPRLSEVIWAPAG